MSLDLTHTALQIDHMSENIKNHRQTHINKIAKALDKIDSFDFKHHESRIENSLGMFNWNIPKISSGSFDKFNSRLSFASDEASFMNKKENFALKPLI